MALTVIGTSANSGSTTGTSLGVALNTTSGVGSGVIIAAITINSADFSSVTAPGLTFTQRGTFNGGQAYFTAPYTSAFNGTITLSASASTLITLQVFAADGAATSSYFDSNASLPGVAATQHNSATISTSNANDLLFIVANPESNGDNLTDSDSQTWTDLLWNGSTSFLGVAYRIVSATKSSFVVTDNSNPMAGSVIDAIKAAAVAGGGSSSGNLSMMGVGHHKHIGWTPLMDRRARIRYPRRLRRWH